jgi:bacteriophage N4 adsorption protein B
MGLFDYSLSFLSWYDIWMLGTVVACALFLLDDIFIDVLAMVNKSKAHKLTKDELSLMDSLPQKKIAIMIANWHEDEVLERMVAGNVNNIDYDNYEFLIGVYPNDTLTLQAARRAERKFKNMTVVVNTKDGPTSKGQMLNLMVNYIEQYNKDGAAAPFDMVMIHDAEDIIHRSSLKLINLRARDYDFIQIPVFSLEIPLSKLTAGIYIDEFVESHTKDLLVRDHFHAGLPSAGVGTAISWPVVAKLLKLQDGDFLNEKTLTEDYHLGLTCHDLRVKSHFSCEYFDLKNERTGESKTEYIATREYFPQKIKQSIRQKTRWALGISLQGFEERRWQTSHFFETYFLWRDRKGLVNAPLFTTSLIFTAYFIGTWLMTGYWPQLQYAPYSLFFIGMMWANLVFSVFRIAQRCFLVNKVYGFKVASLVPVRWILSNFINTSSTYNAIYQWARGKVKGELPAWSKTDHIIPVGFGLKNLDVMDDKAEIRSNEITATAQTHRETLT